MNRLRTASAVAIMALLAAPVAITAWSQDKAESKPGNEKSELYQQLNLFGDVLERVRRDYVEPVDEKTLIENAINGMLSSLDPHSSYMNPKTTRTCRSRPRASSADSASRSRWRTVSSRSCRRSTTRRPPRR